jgi:hypothetical protein
VSARTGEGSGFAGARKSAGIRATGGVKPPSYIVCCPAFFIVAAARQIAALVQNELTGFLPKAVTSQGRLF